MKFAVQHIMTLEMIILYRLLNSQKVSPTVNTIANSSLWLIGASIAANRIKGVRAALCTSPEMAKLARFHNDSNVLVLGGRTTTREMVEQIIDAWLSNEFEGDATRNGSSF